VFHERHAHERFERVLRVFARRLRDARRARRDFSAVTSLRKFAQANLQQRFPLRAWPPRRRVVQRRATQKRVVRREGRGRIDAVGGDERRQRDVAQRKRPRARVVPGTVLDSRLSARGDGLPERRTQRRGGGQRARFGDTEQCRAFRDGADRDEAARAARVCANAHVRVDHPAVRADARGQRRPRALVVVGGADRAFRVPSRGRASALRGGAHAGWSGGLSLRGHARVPTRAAVGEREPRRRRARASRGKANLGFPHCRRRRKPGVASESSEKPFQRNPAINAHNSARRHDGVRVGQRRGPPPGVRETHQGVLPV
jgi:hypothetical protein